MSEQNPQERAMRAFARFLILSACGIVALAVTACLLIYWLVK